MCDAPTCLYLWSFLECGKANDLPRTMFFFPCFYEYSFYIPMPVPTPFPPPTSSTCPPRSKQLTESLQLRCETFHLTPFTMMRFCLSWACPGLEHAVGTTLNSYMKQPCWGHYFLEVNHSLWLLYSVYPVSSVLPEHWDNKVWYTRRHIYTHRSMHTNKTYAIYVVYRVENYAVLYPLHFDQLWVSVLITI